MAGRCERGNEPSVSIKCVEFVDYLRNVGLLRKPFHHGVSWLMRWSCTSDKDARMCTLL